MSKKDLEKALDETEEETGKRPKLEYIQGVYIILLVQVFIFAITVLLARTLLSDFFEAKEDKTHNIGAYICMAVIVLISIFVFFCGSFARKIIISHLLLAIFTAAEAYILGNYTVSTSPKILYWILGLSFSLIFSLLLLAFTTKTDYSIWKILFTLLGWALVAAGAIFLYIKTSEEKEKTWLIVTGSVIAVFGLHLTWNTHDILRKKRHTAFTEKDYFIGALTVHADFVMVFILIFVLIKNLAMKKKEDDEDVFDEEEKDVKKLKESLNRKSTLGKSVTKA